MSCASDQEMSSCSGSPVSYTTLESPHSSPLQQVPQLANTFTGLSFTDKNLYNFTIGSNGNKPHMRIIEQPQNHFRFRYISEMVGTHGCILGKSCANNSKNKTHPTVELVNFSGRALIRCQLAQHHNAEEHPHKLLEDEQDRDVSYIVPEQGIYKVGFPGMGIIHTAKKDVGKLLFKKFSEQTNNRNTNAKDLRAHCDNLAKSMNLNIVRLKFSAHDVETGKQICEPVLSDPIHNMKSAATNDLKICRISMCSGRPRGGEDVFIFVEKVNKKNIMIRFFELDENGERGWSDTGTFLQSDVHHQYAVVFRTPKYRDPQTPVDVKVYIELVRPSDGRTSEPKVFTYKAEQIYKQIKKRKNTSSYSSIESSSGGSITNDLPTVLFNTSLSDDVVKDERGNPIFNIQPSDVVKDEREIPMFNIQLPLQAPSPTAECGLGNALGTILTEQAMPSPMWPQTPGIAPTPASMLPNLQLDSTELNTMSRDVVMEENPTAQQAYLAEYFNSFSLSLGDMAPEEVNGMDFIRTTLVADSGRVKVEQSPSLQLLTSNTKSESRIGPEVDTNTGKNVSAGKGTRQTGTAANSGAILSSPDTSDYPAVYTTSDAAEVKKLVRELCDMIRDKRSTATKAMRDKLDRLFDIRLSNGDTFLHMTLLSNKPCFQTIVKVIQSAKMSHLLNYSNNRGETILHLALVHADPDVVSLLVDKGCDPMSRTIDEETCVHYGVRYGSEPTMRALLDTSARRGVSLDLDALNAERYTALHLCALEGNGSCAALLGARGALVSVCDNAGRNPLHLCAYDAKLQVARALLPHATAADVNAEDSCGRTPLQVVCARAPLDVEMAELLLSAGARADACVGPSRLHPELLAALRCHVPADQLTALLDSSADDVKLEPEDLDDADIKSEPDDQDEYESADDDTEMSTSTGLSELGQYAREVSRRVDAAGKWRELARRLDAEALMSWFQNQPSPAYTLLQHVKECREDLTSKSLALILEDIGLSDAANIIKNYID